MTDQLALFDGFSASPAAGTTERIPDQRWRDDHNAAVQQPRRGFERAVVSIIRGLAEYAAAHRDRYEQPITDDGLLGDYWYELCRQTRNLLDGETGRLDCGTLSSLLYALEESGGAPDAVAKVAEATRSAPELKPRQQKETIGVGMAALSERQRELLNLVRIDGNFAVYTGTEHIPDWGLLKRIMVALGGTWKRKTKKQEGGFRFPDDVDAAEQVRLALETGEVFDPKSAGFFQTPPELVARLLELAGIKPGFDVLEPSAGTGNIALALHESWANVFCVELLEPNAKKLLELGFKVTTGDFLEQTPERLGTFDRVVSNPPFSRQQDVDHVLHARRFLKPEGRLVSIMSAGVRYREDKKSKAFRELVEQRGGWFEDNPEGSFKASGTMVRTCIVVIPRGGHA